MNKWEEKRKKKGLYLLLYNTSMVTQTITLRHRLKQTVKKFILKVQLKIELKKPSITPFN